MTPRTISLRLVGIATALLLLVSALAAPPALARAGCNTGPTAGTADIGLVQSVSGPTALGNYLDHLTITNFGPCNVPNVGLIVTLPGALAAFSSNPSSWSCTGGTTVTCSETSTIGVPGTADIFLEYAPINGTIFACAATFTGTPSCDPQAGPVPDLIPGNNTGQVAAGVLVPGGSLVYGPPTGPTNNNHTTKITLVNGGLVNIYQTPECPVLPAGSPPCFLGTSTVNFGSSVSGSATWTISFLASDAGKSLSQITIWNSVPTINGGAFYPLTPCTGKTPTDPCVQDRSKSGTGAATVFTFVLFGTADDQFTAD